MRNTEPCMSCGNDLNGNRQRRNSVLVIRAQNWVLVFGPATTPAGMELEASTGVWTYRPEAPGVHNLVLGVSDGRFTVERSVQVSVPVPDPEAPTRFSGRLLDADSLAKGVERPIVGARVSLLGVEMSTETDASGRFELTDIPVAEAYVLDLDPRRARPAPLGLGYAGFRERLTLYANVHNEETRPFTLPRLAAASRTQVNPQRETRVINPELGVELRVPAGMALAEDGSLYVGELWISEVPEGLAPAALPEELGFGQLITIQPVGVRFAEPVPITFPNTEGLPAGAPVSIWSVDPALGEFVVVGQGRVSADEQRIETVSGGIRAADWHAPGPQPPDEPEDCEETGEDCPPDDDNPDDCSTPAGSMVCLGNGSLGVSLTLPEYRSLGASRRLEFVYRSDSAYPRPAVSFRVTPGASRLRQTALEYHVRWAGRREAPIVVTVPEEGTETLRLGALLNAAGLESGSYPYALWLTNVWEGQDGTVSRFSGTRPGRVLVDNAQESAFGAGWRLRGLYELKVDEVPVFRPIILGGGGDVAARRGQRQGPEDVPGGQRQGRGGATNVVPGGGLERIGTVIVGVTMIRPGERPVYYRYSREERGFVSPGANFAAVSFLPERTGYLYREKDGREWRFTTEGRLQQMQDRNGNLTRYAYDGAGRLASVTDPVGLVTRLRYRNGHLWQVEDPSGRVSAFERDGHGRPALQLQLAGP